MSSVTTTPTIPGYVTGRWNIDPVHSDVSFSVRHLMVSKVRGRFRSVRGTIVTAGDPLDSSVAAEIDTASVDTGDEHRDAHVRSADFLDVEKYPTLTYRSLALHPDGGRYRVDGELTLHGVTRPVELQLEFNGFTPDPYGGTRVGLSATGSINRRDFGLDISMPMDGGGVVVGDKIEIALEIQAVLES